MQTVYFMSIYGNPVWLFCNDMQALELLMYEGWSIIIEKNMGPVFLVTGLDQATPSRSFLATG